MLPKEERKMLICVRDCSRKDLPGDVIRFESKKLTPAQRAAVVRLRERGLLSHPQITPGGVTAVYLTVSGRDLADKYASSWHFSKILYQEYLTGHPIWLVIAGVITFMLGIAAGLALAFLQARFFPPS